LKSIYRSELNYKRYVSSSTNNLNKTFYKWNVCRIIIFCLTKYFYIYDYVIIFVRFL
jgi:hypothetical protein